MSFRFGRRRPTAPNPHPHLLRYVASDAPAPPASVDYYRNAGRCLTDILGNDVLGDCTAACYAHAIGLWTDGAVCPTREQTVAFYSACSGYIAGNAATDQGADELVVIQTAKTVGLAGRVLDGAVTVDASNPGLVASAIWLFGCVFLCAELADVWLPTHLGETWAIPADPDPRQGHCFLGYGYDASGVYIDTWGLVSERTPTRISWEAAAKFCVPSGGGGCYAPISREWLDAQGKAPNGYDLETLVRDAAGMGVIL